MDYRAREPNAEHSRRRVGVAARNRRRTFAAFLSFWSCSGRSIGSRPSGSCNVRRCGSRQRDSRAARDASRSIGCFALRIGAFMFSVFQDVQFGLRMLMKHRLATLVSIVALALGLGANTAMFSLAEAFLLHPVPLENADRIVALVDSRPGQNIDMNAVAPATYFDWKQQAHSFDDLAAYAWQEVNLTGDGEPQKVQTFRVSANFFPMLGVRAQLGRSFLSEEEEPGKDHEIIMGHALWEQRYASDPHIIGRTIKVDGKAHTVVGVMGKGFDFPMPAEAWMPLAPDTKMRLSRNDRWLWVLARLKPGISYAQAAAEMQGIAQRQAELYPDTNKGWQLRPMLLREFVTGYLTRQYTILLLGAVGFVLLIACADVANVQFARMSGRAT